MDQGFSNLPISDAPRYDKRRAFAKQANALLLITLLVYVTMSVILEVLAILFGGVLPILNSTLFHMVALHASLVTPSVIYILTKKLSLRDFMHFRMLNPVTLLLVIVFTYVSYPIIALCNQISLLFADNVIDNTMESLFSQYPIGVCIIVVALIPCFVEEFIFRGALYHSYKKSGAIKAMLLTALLFGLFHMNLNQMSYAVVIGALFVCLNEATGSIISSILMHFLINATSVVSSGIYYKQHGNLDVSSAEAMNPYMTIAVLAVMSAFSLAFLFLLLWGMAAIEQRMPAVKSLWKGRGGSGKILSACLVIALVICISLMLLFELAS